MKIDFAELERAVWAATAHDLGVQPEVRWCTEYPAAIEIAIVMNNFAPLIRLLDAGEPMHPLCLPALSEALRLRGRPGRSGRKPALTTIEASRVAAWVMTLRHPMTGRMKRRSPTQAIAKAAADYGVSTAAVKRAVARARRGS